MADETERLFKDESLSADEAAVDDAIRRAGGERTAIRALLIEVGKMSSAAQPGEKLAKGGVILDDLVRADDAPAALIGGRNREKAARLMAAIDGLNAKHGRGAVTPPAVGIKRGWQTKFEMRSPRHTTRVDELPIAGAH